MIAPALTLARNQPAAAAAIAIAVLGVLTMAGFFYFQYVLGYPPCPLCLEQRYAFYISVPLAAMVLLGLSVGSSRKVLMLALFAVAAAMLWNAGLGTYHSGVEWHWWPGPQDCSGAMPNFSSAAACSIRSIGRAWFAATRRRGASSACRSPATTCWCRCRSPPSRSGARSASSDQGSSSVSQ